MKLAGLITEGSAAHNEDAAGFVQDSDGVIAAWVFDGVTGINNRNYLNAPSDAGWIVAKADAHLRSLAAQDITLPEILRRLVDRLKADWKKEVQSIDLPSDYDIPAACLLLVKRYADGWRALRLGDSFLLTLEEAVQRWEGPETDLGGLEDLLRREAKKQRAEGITNFKSLLRQFHPQLMASRRARNSVGNHSILVADESSLAIPEYIDLAWPQSILLCSDGFYRAVDTYALMGDEELVATCSKTGGVANVLRNIRAVESNDPNCIEHLRFKPADDASAVMLVTS